MRRPILFLIVMLLLTSLSCKTLTPDGTTVIQPTSDLQAATVEVPTSQVDDSNPSPSPSLPRTAARPPPSPRLPRRRYWKRM